MSDFEELVPLESLDPGSRDPGFWLRFHRRVMVGAQSELARRKMEAALSVEDVVFAWRRALVPLAFIAAALAAVLLIGSEPQPAVQLVALEDALTEGLNLLTSSGVVFTGEGAIQEGIFAVVEGGF
jgi:hypothetical protein